MNFFKNVLQNTRSMKTCVSFQFSKQENHALYLIMSSSNKKSVYCALKKVIFEG